MSNDGLLDFGTGALSGATAGSAFGPAGSGIGAGIGAGVGGLISLFGNSKNRANEDRNNALYFKQQNQGMQLGRLQLSQALRDEKAAKAAEQKKQVFGRMLGQWFKDNQAKGMV